MNIKISLVIATATLLAACSGSVESNVSTSTLTSSDKAYYAVKSAWHRLSADDIEALCSGFDRSDALAVIMKGAEIPEGETASSWESKINLAIARNCADQG